MNITKESLHRILARIAVGRSPRRTLVRAGILAVVSIIIFKFILIPARLRGVSMQPTWPNGRFVLVNTLTYAFEAPRRGDIVAIRMAGNNVMLFKRIIGLPGERVAFREGVLMINGQAVSESYLPWSGEWNMAETACGTDEYFVAGDNRALPIERHALGRVQRKKIIGGPWLF